MNIVSSKGVQPVAPSELHIPHQTWPIPVDKKGFGASCGNRPPHAILRIAKWQISGVQCVQQYLKHPEATLFTNHVDKL